MPPSNQYLHVVLVGIGSEIRTERYTSTLITPDTAAVNYVLLLLYTETESTAVSYIPAFFRCHENQAGQMLCVFIATAECIEADVHEPNVDMNRCRYRVASSIIPVVLVRVGAT